MSEHRWSSDETFKFIELYQSEPVIWNPKHKYHKDKCAVNEAWKRIADTLSILVPELKKKKESLLAAFRLNQRKVLASKRYSEEDVYKPIWVYYDALAAFMSDVYECKTNLFAEEEESQYVFVSEEAESDENQVMHSVQKRRCQQSLDTAETCGQSCQMNTALSALMKKALTDPLENEDDCDLYAKLLAHKLRSFSVIERQELMYEIDGFILKKRKRKIESSEAPPQS